MKALEWICVDECGYDENSEPLCYAAVVFPHRFGSARFVWLEKADHGWNVMRLIEDEFVVLCNCVSLLSAKRWVARYLYEDMEV